MQATQPMSCPPTLSEEQIAAARAVFPHSQDLAIVAIGDAAKIRDTMKGYGPLTEMKLTDPRFSP